LALLNSNRIQNNQTEVYHAAWWCAPRCQAQKKGLDNSLIRLMLDGIITDAEWDKLLRQLCAQALKGNLHATQLLLTYRF